MKKLRVFLSNFLKEEDAQGATEYILLLVAVIAVLVLFKDKIMEMVKGKIGTIESEMGKF